MESQYTIPDRVFWEAHRTGADYEKIGWCRFCGKSRKSQYNKCDSCNKKLGGYRRLQKKAISYVSAAVMVGKLPPAKSLVCADCGSAARHYDHRDYSRPAEVEPVCCSCNQRRGPAKQYFEFLQPTQPSAPESPPTG